jgi:hypothetical protein
MMDSRVDGRCVRVRHLARIAMVSCLLAAAAACDEPAPTAPGPMPVVIEGTWAGSMIDRSAGTGQIQLTASGIETLATGTFTLAFADSSANVSGVVLGRTQNAPAIELSLAIQSAGRDCLAPGGTVFAHVTLSGSRMTGTYDAGVGCPLLGGGSIELSKR